MGPSRADLAKGRGPRSKLKVTACEAGAQSMPAIEWTPPNFNGPSVPTDERASSKEVLSHIGTRLRARHKALGMSILDVAEATGLSISMVSLAERARTSPSIGTLVVICDTLSMSVSDHFSPSPEPTNPVVHRGDQWVQPMSNGMKRRLLAKLDATGIGVSEHQFVGRGATSSLVLTHHRGYGIGVVISGALSVELEYETCVLRAGDCIRFAFSTPHRFTNEISERTKTMWLNVKSDLEQRLLGGPDIEPAFSDDLNGGSECQIP